MSMIDDSDNSMQNSRMAMESMTLGVSALEKLKTSAAERYTKEKSSFVIVGLNVHTAPVEIREKVNIPESQWPQAISELCDLNHIEEAAVLSTCNRIEIYVKALSQHRGVKEVTEWMSKVRFTVFMTSGVPVSELCKHRILLYNKDATQHLFEVASGLDSLVLGEGQILSQGVAGFGSGIGGLFKHAITAGKRVRTETNISSGSVSVSSAAVELALLKLHEPCFANARVLVVGAGKMGKLVIKHLIAKGCEKMVVVNRSEERVAAITEEFRNVEITYKPFSELLSSAAEADLIFTKVQMLPPVHPGVGNRLFVDISVPRNVDSSISDLETARVYDVDDLKEVVSANMEDRLRKAREAQVIIDEELGKFEAWKDSRETVPTIKKFRAYVERIRAAELDKCLSKLGENISKKDKQAVYDLSMGIVKKLLHGPMEHLRCDGSDDSGRSLNEAKANEEQVQNWWSPHFVYKRFVSAITLH
ncbi:hypothetical protein F8388_023593 [Cannabis sativa]|uniref:Glutamyl-tRNA reductase n=1 Tax=Cannabis sativa TaxID=3483 RepID=A0A7J6G9C3_CANSA|nr:hypothetical protein F8388_023593 [Cannabis sativa]